MKYSAFLKRLPLLVLFLTVAVFIFAAIQPHEGTDGYSKEEKNKCLEAGADYSLFSNTCGDACKTVQSQVCGEAGDYNCDCGPDQCWDGSTCIDKDAVNEGMKLQNSGGTAESEYNPGWLTYWDDLLYFRVDVQEATPFEHAQVDGDEVFKFGSTKVIHTTRDLNKLLNMFNEVTAIPTELNDSAVFQYSGPPAIAYFDSENGFLAVHPGSGYLLIHSDPSEEDLFLVINQYFATLDPALYWDTRPEHTNSTY